MGYVRIVESNSWDFYFTAIEGHPGSIFLDFKYELGHEPRDHATLGVVEIGMLDPGEDGVGTAIEMAALGPLDEQIAGTALGRFVFVGRSRSAGKWELAYYGGPEIETLLTATLDGLDLGGRAVEVWSRHDPEWTVYDRALFPKPERRQWMHDRDAVHSLEQQGDDLTAKRPVDHFAYFRTATARDAFAGDAAKAGFRLEKTSDDADPVLPFAAHIAREDSVDLKSIHDVVMTLVALAEQHDGSYDGWGTAIVKPKSGLLRRRRQRDRSRGLQNGGFAE